MEVSPLIVNPVKVLVIGAGAAGCAAAWSLTRPEHNCNFQVSLWEKESIAGGVATTETIAEGVRANVGVQGGAPSYRNVLKLHESLGFSPLWVSMTVAFGKGGSLWGNQQPDGVNSEFMSRMEPEIRRFGKLLKWIYRLEPFSVMIPIGILLRNCGFSEDFCNLMVYPLTALFFGTGNQTPRVAAAIVARVFLDPQLRLFDYDPKLLISEEASMFSFGELGSIYSSLVKQIQENGGEVCFNRVVKKVKRNNSKQRNSVEVMDSEGNNHYFDQVIFACNSEVILQILDSPSFLEKKCLGAVKYYDDLTVTHTDSKYMDIHYGADLDNDMYYIHTDQEDSQKIEMSFNLANYQPHLRDSGKKRLFQTIFLDKAHEDGWTRAGIDKKKIVSEHWWRQFAHVWTHYAFAVPLIRFIQGTSNTWYAGSWTLVNTHEIATISGLACAARLGASYPFSDDPLAKSQFEQYMNIIHGSTIHGNPTLLTYIIRYSPYLLVAICLLITFYFLYSILF